MTEINSKMQASGGALHSVKPSSVLRDAELKVDKAQTAPSETQVHELDRRQDVAAEGNTLPADASSQRKKPVEEAVAEINSFIQDVRRDLNFSVDSDSGNTIVRVTDTKTGEVVRQIPTEIVIRLAERLESEDEAQAMSGNLINAKI